MKGFGLILKLGVSILLIMLFGDYVPEEIQRAFFTVSVFMKETLVFFMPFIVFAFIFACLSSFQQRAPLLVVMTLGLVVISNFVCAQLGYFAGHFTLSSLGYGAQESLTIASQGAGLAPYFTLPYPSLLSTDLALFLGMLMGIYGAFWGNETLVLWADKFKNLMQKGLTKIFIPLVPLYVIGFLFKLQHEESLVTTLANYGPMIGIVVMAQLISVLSYFWIATRGQWREMKISLQNVFPSGLVAFSTMSSVATLPLTLEAAEKNTNNKALAQVMVPATANIHHVGDSVGVPILIAAVLLINGVEPMSYGTFLIFSLYYMVAKFGVASVPGGEVIILLPILEPYFGFTDSMSGLLTMLYVLIDPFITVSSVLANGAFAIFMDKLCGRMKAFQGLEEASQEVA